MFYDVTKFLGFFLTAPNAFVFLILLATLSLYSPWRRAARLFTVAAALLLAFVSFSPISSILLLPLENRFPQPVLREAPTGLVVLGGMTDEAITKARDAVMLTDAAERLTEAVALSLRYPSMRLVFTGGTGRPGGDAVTEADSARRFWLEMGVPAARMTFEDRSRNTWENGVFTKALVDPKPGEQWLLVTSASHMPRSVGIFRKVGFPIVPYPVDYHTAGNGGDFKGLRNAADAFNLLAIASHEWIGLVGYYLSGKTSALFPAPD